VHLSTNNSVITYTIPAGFASKIKHYTHITLTDRVHAVFLVHVTCLVQKTRRDELLYLLGAIIIVKYAPNKEGIQVAHGSSATAINLLGNYFV